MNVLVVNKNEQVFNNLNIEIIKTLKGEFEVEEIISTLSNFLFSKLIIDITAIKNYDDITNFQKLTIGIPTDKIILLLPSDPNYTEGLFISRLISIGYYNFTTNSDGIRYLLNKPNTYKEVAHLHNIEQVNNVSTSNDNIPIGKIIGFKNVTDHAGATTLVYTLKKQIEKYYNLKVKALEIDKQDFSYFNDNSLISIKKEQLNETIIKEKNNNIILIDLNDMDASICDTVFYLIEPSIIKINKLVNTNRFILGNLKDKKIVLNKTMLSNDDVIRFSKETELNVISVVGPFNDRRDDLFLEDFIEMLINN